MHHIFEGLRRKASDRMGITTTLCQKCHDAVHRYPKRYEYLKAEAQKTYMRTHNMTLEQWLEVMHKNYIGDDYERSKDDSREELYGGSE